MAKWSLLLNRCYGQWDNYPCECGKSRPKKRELYCGEFESNMKDAQAIAWDVTKQWLNRVGREWTGSWAFCVEEKQQIFTLYIGGIYGFPHKVRRVPIVHG